MIDLSKKYTSNGHPVIGLVQIGDQLGGWRKQEELYHAMRWRLDGVSDDNIRHNLKEYVEPVTVRVWFNVYNDYVPSGRWFLNRNDADKNCTAGRIACIEREITYTPGEGLQAVDDK